ncbi:uncharacterized protein H6S33_008662 [Morchella sextelata]|jgi:hypothetical protein|uniref:uncharacterized protein n=1 Tax=Morchella sextelata TaxID=1174677 RepID=UPI001D04F087|nr:uncharacterized protein H6S33_008662 [Morchella sextelata]KAH0602581.1 hypothetical protein H6S33_008662 [Morchella sextelata]
MFKLLPLLLLAVLLLSFTEFTAAILDNTRPIEGNTICETSSGSPLTAELMELVKTGPGFETLCVQKKPNDANGRPGCTWCGGLAGGNLKISICGVKGSRFNFKEVKEALKRLVKECTKTYGLRRIRKTGGMWRDRGGQFTVLAHL